MLGNQKIFSLLLTIFIITGFFIVLDDIREVKREVKNLSVNSEIIFSKLGESIETVQPGQEQEEAEKEPPIAKDGLTSIPTAILVNVNSSPILSPQTLLTISIEKVSKDSQGFVSVALRIFTSRAQSYSAINPADLIELINIGSTNQSAVKVRGEFNSMPPQSAVTGEVIFKIAENQNEIILQLKSADNITLYRFNFRTKSYEEAILG